MARSNLGLTQVLAIQGRYGEADAAVQSAIATLTTLAAADGNARLLLSRAHRNRATPL